MDIKRLSHSSMSCAKTCLRMYQLRYVHGLVKRKIETPLYVGSLFHLGLELGEVPEKPDEPEWLGMDGDYDDDKYKNDCDYYLGAAMIRAYLEYWSDDKVETIKTEWEFAQAIHNPASSGVSRNFRSAGKVDKIVKIPDGRLAIMEYKTTSSDLDPSGVFWRKLCMDQQISHYMLAALQEKIEVETILYDVTRRPGLRPKMIPSLDAEGLKIVLDGDGVRVYNKDGKKPRQTGGDGMTVQTAAETPQAFGLRVFEKMSSNPEEFFCRREIPRLESDLVEYRYELWQQQKMLNECYRNDFWYRNTGACFKWNKPCAYFDICTSGIEFTEGDAAPLGFKFKRQHAELSAPEGGTE